MNESKLITMPIDLSIFHGLANEIRRKFIPVITSLLNGIHTISFWGVGLLTLYYFSRFQPLRLTATVLRFIRRCKSFPTRKTLVSFTKDLPWPSHFAGSERGKGLWITESGINRATLSSFCFLLRLRTRPEEKYGGVLRFEQRNDYYISLSHPSSPNPL